MQKPAQKTGQDHDHSASMLQAFFQLVQDNLATEHARKAVVEPALERAIELADVSWETHLTKEIRLLPPNRDGLREKCT